MLSLNLKITILNAEAARRGVSGGEIVTGSSRKACDRKTSKGGTRMKVSMKRQLKAFVLAMLCIVLVVPAMNVSAVTQRQKAMAA